MLNYINLSKLRRKHVCKFHSYNYRLNSLLTTSSTSAEWKAANTDGCKTLVIVESPTKAKTIEKFLKEANLDNYIVDFSAGHVRDLPRTGKMAPQELKKKIVIEELKLNVADLGVDVENNFEPIYVPVPGKDDVVSRLKEEAKVCSRILLATDEDREGEAISWHLLELLDPKVPFKRAVFNEITQNAIMEAFNNPRDIDMNLVQSQETRRILDRLTGYTISPILWRYVAPGLSAGRVQSCGLDMIAERERARWDFKPSKYYSIEAEFSPITPDLSLKDDEIQLKGRLVKLNDQKIATNSDFDGDTGGLKINNSNNKDQDLPLVLDSDLALSTLKWLSGVDNKYPMYSIANRSEKKVSRKAPAPFITSTLQQQSSSLLGMSPSQTMSVAQQLYELGFITYMRTDSPILSNTARSVALHHVKDMFGDEYIGSDTGSSSTSSKATKGNKKTEAPKNAQEAHEAIRPAESNGLFRPPYDTGLEGPQLKLYSLIYRRTLASVMKNSDSLTTTYIIDATDSDNKDNTATLRASGNRIVFPGYLAALRMPVDMYYSPMPFDYKEGLPDVEVGTEMQLLSGPVTELSGDDAVEEIETETEGGEAEMASASVTSLHENDNETKHKKKGVNEGLMAIEHITRGPSRFSEASFIKELEAVGVGRPSTYAKILQILKERGYVHVDKQTIVPTLTGMMVAGLLNKHFSQIVEPHFTASMESSLDEIASGTCDKTEFLADFYLGATNDGLMPDVVHKLNSGIIDHRESRSLSIPSLKGLGMISMGRSGAFIEEAFSPLPSISSSTILNDEGIATEQKARKWKLPESLETDIRAITPEAIKTVMEKEFTTDGFLLGNDPLTEKPVTLRSGRFGKYVLIGDETSTKAKDKSTHSVPQWLDQTHSFEQVLQFTRLPIEIGAHPSLDLPIIVDVVQKKLSVGVKGYPHRVALDNGIFPDEVSLETASLMLEDTKAIIESETRLGMWEKEGEEPQEISIRKGRFGPYLRAGTIIAGLRKLEPSDVTLEMAIEILETRGKVLGSRKKTKAKAKSKSKAKTKTKPATKVKTKRKVKAKVKVKRAPSAYIIFSSEIRPTVKEENPDMKFGDIAKECAIRWKSLTDEEKAVYNAKSAAIAAEMAL